MEEENERLTAVVLAQAGEANRQEKMMEVKRQQNSVYTAALGALIKFGCRLSNDRYGKLRNLMSGQYVKNPLFPGAPVDKRGKRHGKFKRRKMLSTDVFGAALPTSKEVAKWAKEKGIGKLLEVDEDGGVVEGRSFDLKPCLIVR